jgi:hypothetical protein
MRWLRAFLLVAAAQGYAIGLTGLAKPSSIVGFPLETTPLNDRFVASFYLAGAIGLTLTALARRMDDTRVLLAAFPFATVLLLVVTLAYWSDFSTKRVPYAWLISYIVDPVLGGAAILGWRLWSTERPRARGVGLLFLVEAGVLGALGVLLLAAPGTAIDAWPWHLTEVLSRTYGSIFLALGLGAFLAARESRAAAIVPFLVTSAVFSACGLAVYVLHSSHFDGGDATQVWLALNSAGVAAFGTALLTVLRGSPVVAEVAVPAER